MKRSEYRVRLLQAAENDLMDIASFIGADNPSAAEILIDRIEQNLAHLETHPFLGRAPDDNDLADLGYRYLIVSGYLIFYTIRRKTILVHRIIHGARNYKDVL